MADRDTDLSLACGNTRIRHRKAINCEVMSATERSIRAAIPSVSVCSVTGNTGNEEELREVFLEEEKKKQDRDRKRKSERRYIMYKIIFGDWI